MSSYSASTVSPSVIDLTRVYKDNPSTVAKINEIENELKNAYDFKPLNRIQKRYLQQTSSFMARENFYNLGSSPSQNATDIYNRTGQPLNDLNPYEMNPNLNYLNQLNQHKASFGPLAYYPMHKHLLSKEHDSYRGNTADINDIITAQRTVYQFCQSVITQFAAFNAVLHIIFATPLSLFMSNAAINKDEKYVMHNTTTEYSPNSYIYNRLRNCNIVVADGKCKTIEIVWDYKTNKAEINVFEAVNVPTGVIANNQRGWVLINSMHSCTHIRNSFTSSYILMNGVVNVDGYITQNNDSKVGQKMIGNDYNEILPQWFVDNNNYENIETFNIKYDDNLYEKYYSLFLIERPKTPHVSQQETKPKINACCFEDNKEDEPQSQQDNDIDTITDPDSLKQMIRNLKTHLDDKQRVNTMQAALIEQYESTGIKTDEINEKQIDNVMCNDSKTSVKLEQQEQVMMTIKQLFKEHKMEEELETFKSVVNNKINILNQKVLDSENKCKRLYANLKIEQNKVIELQEQKEQLMIKIAKLTENKMEEELQEQKAPNLVEMLKITLRHDTAGLNIKSDALIKVDDIASLPIYKQYGFTTNHISDIVQPLFAMQRINGHCYIRANRGHSIRGITRNLGYKSISRNQSKKYKTVCHGACMNNWDQIIKYGIRSGSKKDIKFIPSKDCENWIFPSMEFHYKKLIHVDIEACVRDDIEFFLSAGNVILSPGIEGVIPPKYLIQVNEFECGKVGATIWTKQRPLLKRNKKHPLTLLNELARVTKLNARIGKGPVILFNQDEVKQNSKAEKIWFTSLTWFYNNSPRKPIHIEKRGPYSATKLWKMCAIDILIRLNKWDPKIVECV